VHRGKPDDEALVGLHERIASDDQRIGSEARGGLECVFKTLGRARVENLRRDPQGAGGFLDRAPFRASRRVGQVHESRNAFASREQLFKDGDPFSLGAGSRSAKAGQIGGRRGAANNGLRIASRRHHDRNRAACRLGRERRRRSPRDDHIDIETHQFSCQLSEAFVVATGRSIFEDEVLTLDIAAFAQSLLKRAEIGVEPSRTRIQHPDTVAPKP